MSTILEDLTAEILRVASKTTDDLKTSSVELSELHLFLDDSDSPVIEFDVLGQNFLLTAAGVFTFNELGEAFVPRPEFRKALEGVLNWRLSVLKRFDL